MAREESGEDVVLEKVRQSDRPAIRRVVLRPAAVRDFERLDRLALARIRASLSRYAMNGQCDVKSLRDRPGEFRLCVGKWRIFICLEQSELVRVLGVDSRGAAY
jgi:mRNA-degrading endonuclease RelE of RelBE toxin-antitoxin system